MRLIDVDDLGVGRCSRDILPAAYCAGWNGLLGLIENAPTVDAVAVTRCKDCKYADGKKESPAEKRYVADILVCRNSNLCGDEPLAMWPEDFCSYGEPREGTHADNHD